ncbi:MAG: preprotein translocase subunit SecG [Oscillospiraceae bacterium]
MNIFEIISAIILIIACVFIIVVVLMKETKNQMSQTISGTTADSYYGKNSGRTKDAMLNKATIAAMIVFFVLALSVNIINVYFGGKADDTSSTDTSSVVSVTDDVSSDITADASSDSAADDTSAESEAGSDTESAAE